MPTLKRFLSLLLLTFTVLLVGNAPHLGMDVLASHDHEKFVESDYARHVLASQTFPGDFATIVDLEQWGIDRTPQTREEHLENVRRYNESNFIVVLGAIHRFWRQGTYLFNDA